MMCAGEGDGGQGKQRLILKSRFKIVVVISCIFLFKKNFFGWAARLVGSQGLNPSHGNESVES